jgi:hypothetical protein
MPTTPRKGLNMPAMEDRAEAVVPPLWKRGLRRGRPSRDCSGENAEDHFMKSCVVSIVQQDRRNSNGREGVWYTRVIQQFCFAFHGTGFRRSIAQSISTHGRYNNSDDHHDGDGDADADSEECLNASGIKER